MRTSMEKFPDHIEPLDRQSPYPVSPTRPNGYTNGSASADRWQPRRDSGLRGSAWNGQASTGGKHNRQKSLTDAFRTIRTRKASVSANVHEVAVALKAPVSPKLVVSSSPRSTRTEPILIVVGLMSCLVYVKCFDKHLVEIYPQCLPKTSNSYPDTIRLRRLYVSLLLLPGNSLSYAPKQNSGSTISSPVPYTRSYFNNYSYGCVPNRWPPPIFKCHHEDPRLACPHD